MNITKLFLISQKEFDIAKCKDQIKLKCEICNEGYTREKHSITSKYKLRNQVPRFCSKACHNILIGWNVFSK